MPLAGFRTSCDAGLGMAVCPVQGVVVTADTCNTLTVFALPTLARAGAVRRVCTLGGTVPPMNFCFLDMYGICKSGWMAFSGALLALVDAGNKTVHVLDVLHRKHVGYIAAPGTIAFPRCVAARGSLVAVSSPHVVQVYKGSGAEWTLARVIAGVYNADIWGLRFAADGTGLAVVDRHHGRLSLFCVEDGSFVRDVATGLELPIEVEDCAEYGWAVSCWRTYAITFVGGIRHQASLGKRGKADGEFILPSALAWVPGLGLVVREYCSSLQFFATPDDIAMASMSCAKTTWMATVARAMEKISAVLVAVPK